MIGIMPIYQLHENQSFYPSSVESGSSSKKKMSQIYEDKNEGKRNRTKCSRCSYTWSTNTVLRQVTCPNCGYKVRRLGLAKV